MCDGDNTHSHNHSQNSHDHSVREPEVHLEPAIQVRVSAEPAEGSILTLNRSSTMRSYALLRAISETVQESTRLRRDLLLTRKRLASKNKSLNGLRKAYDYRRAEAVSLRQKLKETEAKLQALQNGETVTDSPSPVSETANA